MTNQHNQQVGLKVLLTAGHFLAVVLERSLVLRLIEDWESGKLALAGPKRLGGTCLLTGTRWSFAVDDVIGVHTFAADAVKAQLPPPPGPQGGVWTPKSGIA